MFNPQPKPQPKEKKPLTPYEFRVKYFRSKKRKKQEAEYSQRRKHFLSGKRCQRCGCKATTVHHSKGRIGVLLNDVSCWIALCFPCHEWVERNPQEAKEKGFSKDRL